MGIIYSFADFKRADAIRGVCYRLELQINILHLKKGNNSHFFLNQQFITRGARAGRGSYFVTTYIKTHVT